MEWPVSELKAAEHVYTSQIILCFEKSFGNRKWSYKLQYNYKLSSEAKQEAI